MQMKLPVTWINPDIKLFLGKVEQYTYDLKPNTTYDVVITVHNSSRDKPASGTQVSLRWIEFGAGAQIRHPITTLVADVPVWPDVATVSTSWLTPSMPGHFCIEVELSHPNDGNPANNRGWRNTMVKKSQSPVETPIRIFNRWIPDPHQSLSRKTHEQNGGSNRIPLNLVEITLDSYVFKDSEGEVCDADAMFAPRSPVWSAHVEPNLFHFNDNETFRDAKLIVDVPNKQTPSEVFNVTVRQGGIPTGGVTVTVTR
jgi:hypothetical protein